ncbi:Trafficking protein particle complex subunit 8 [Nymphaea thermarum]|nr:Trafficking protein particle complex subunit 8 [Nymphaea thermarum]
MNLSAAADFRNKNYVSSASFPNQPTTIKDPSNGSADIGFNQFPIGLIKSSVEAVWRRAASALGMQQESLISWMQKVSLCSAEFKYTGLLEAKMLSSLRFHFFLDKLPVLALAVEILTEMRGTFGSSSCQLLCINSSLGEGDECQSKPWTNKEADASNDHEIGRFLDVNDLNEIRDLLQELSTKHIIPYMEQKIRILNAQVSTTRKGFKNQIKNLWWRKAKEEAADDPNGPKYSFSSLESQIRVLGDHAFMLRDYELALSSYRLLSTDYKIDKAWKRYAGVQVFSIILF